MNDLSLNELLSSRNTLMQANEYFENSILLADREQRSNGYTEDMQDRIDSNNMHIQDVTNLITIKQG